MSEFDDPSAPDVGTPGGSARREGARRKTNRERRIRARHPRIGGVLLALRDEPAHERVWERGAAGEEHVAKFLTKYLNDAVVVLHDRRIPQTRANIDHIAIAPSGVWVIDSKRYTGKVAISRALFGDAKLIINGRDKTKLIAGLERQVELVKTEMRSIAADAPVQGALCFVDAELPWLSHLTLNGYPLLHVKPLAKRINADGPVAPEGVSHVAAELAQRFPTA